MRAFLRRLFIDQGLLLEVISDYRELFNASHDLNVAKDAEIAKLKLEHARWNRAVVENFMTSLLRGDEDLYDKLEAALRDYDDEVARMEEHA